MKKLQKFAGTVKKKNFVYCIIGLCKNYASLPFGQKLEYSKIISEFLKNPNTKTFYVGTKGKSTLPAVKKAIKLELKEGDQYYAEWEADRNYYKDDSVKIHVLKIDK